MKNLLQTFFGALVFGLIVYFLFVVYDKNKDRISWGETNKKLSEEAEQVSRDVDKSVRKVKKVYDKVKKEMNNGDGATAPPSPDGLSGADKSTPTTTPTENNTPRGNTTSNTPTSNTIPETVVTSPQTTTSGSKSSTTTANSNDGTPYDIQLGLVKSSAYKPDTWRVLSDLGILSVQSVSDNRKKILLGTFYGRPRAEEVLNMVKSRGFTDAFLLTGDKANTVNLPQIDFNKRRLTSNSYMIQLAAMRSPQAKRWKDMRKLGNLYFEYAADLDITKILIGPYQNESEAAEALQKAKASGYPRAFTRRLTVHEVSNMEQMVF